MKEFFKLIISEPILLIMTLLIVGLTTFLGTLMMRITEYDKVVGFIGSNYKKLSDSVNSKKALKNARYYTKTIEIKMSKLDKLDLKYIERSNIRRWVPFFNVYFLLACSFIIFLFAFVQFYKLLYSPFAAAAIAGMFTYIPFAGLDVLGRRNTEKIRAMLSDFIAVLKSWCAVKEDIVYAFEQSVKENDLEEPLRSYIKDVVIQIKRGLEPQEALYLLQLKIDSAQFRNFVINIEQTLKNRGNIVNLLNNMSEQFDLMEKERYKRKLKNTSNRVYIFFAAIAVLVLGFIMLKANNTAVHFYLETSEGKYTIAVLAFMYFCAFILALKISDFKY